MPGTNLTDSVIKEQLTDLITKGNAHVTFEQVTKNIPFKDLGIRPANLPYSIWKLVEHIRITQWDILEFSRDPNHKSPKWPEEYWPEGDAPKDEKEWDQCLEKIKKDTSAFIALLHQPDADLYTPFIHGDGQNLLREAMLIADHTSYHCGEIVLLRRLLGNWV